MRGLQKSKFDNNSGLYVQAELKTEEPDFVRRYWEDELIRHSLKPFVQELVAEKSAQNKKIRILDLGCAKGHGYEILTKINSNFYDLTLNKSYVLPEDQIGSYIGLDLHYEDVEQANESYRHKKNVRFFKTDLRSGLGPWKAGEPAFDIYFSSYGALSALKPAELYHLLRDVCKHAGSGSLLVIDLMGEGNISNRFAAPQTTHTYWNFDSVKSLLREIHQSLATGMELLRKTDRSILIAYHKSNLLLGSTFKTIRNSVNSLFKSGERTNLSKLLLSTDFIASDEKGIEDKCLIRLISSWNLFVKYAIRRIEKQIPQKTPEGWETLNKTLQFGIQTLDRLLEDTSWIAYGDTRANIIEPHIAYVLRSLEYELQNGTGNGQHLSLILKIHK